MALIDVSNEDLGADLTAAFPSFVRRHQRSVFSTALALCGGDRAEAEDLAQDVFVRAYRALEDYDPERRRALSERAWLSTITLNAGRNWARRRNRRPQIVPLEAAAEPVEPRGGPERVADRDWWAAQVAALPERYRAPLVLRHVYGLGASEVAAALGRPVGTVKAQVHRGLALLRRAVERREEQ